MQHIIRTLSIVIFFSTSILSMERDNQHKSLFALQKGMTQNFQTAALSFGLNATINTQDELGLTLLHKAVIQNNEKLVSFYSMVPTINVNIQDKNGCTPLHLAAYYRYETIVKHLLSINSINVNIQNNDHLTPLHFAVTQGHESIVRQLLNISTIDLTLESNDKLTAFEIAYKKGFTTILELFFAQNRTGSNLEIQERQVNTNNIPCVALIPTNGKQ